MAIKKNESSSSLKIIEKNLAKYLFFLFNNNMNLIPTSFSQGISLLTNWVDISKPLPEVIDTVTYDLYESNNPFRQKNDKKIDNKALRYTVNTTSKVGAEVFSAFTNPYYLAHKVINLPFMYKNATETYKKYAVPVDN